MRLITRVFLLVLLYLLSAGAFAEPYLCLSGDSFAMLLNDSGQAVIPAGLYDSIIPLVEGENYAVGKSVNDKTLYALYNIEDGLLTDFAYSMLEYSSGRILFRVDNCVGAMDLKGNHLIPAQYRQLLPCSDGYIGLANRANDSSENEILYLQSNGSLVNTGIFTSDALHPFSSGRSAYTDPKSLLVGFLDEKLSVAIEPRYEYAEDFTEGNAIVYQNGAYQLIQPDGESILEGNYTYMVRFGSMICGLKRETASTSAISAWDGDGTPLFTVIRTDPVSVEPTGDCIVIRSENMTEIFDSKGQSTVLSDSEVSILPGANGHLIFRDGDWGEACAFVWNPADNKLSGNRFQFLTPIDDQCCLYAEFRVIRYNSIEFNDVRLSSDYTSILYGLTDDKGNVLTEAKYRQILPLGNHYYAALAEDTAEILRSDASLLTTFPLSSK